MKVSILLVHSVLLLVVISKNSCVQDLSCSVNQAVIPAAGLGTRFLPWTSVYAKEMLPLPDVPALQRVIKEAVSAGVTTFRIIVSEDKKDIATYFSPKKSLEEFLHTQGKAHLMQSLNEILRSASFSYIIQPVMRGLGDAILMAQSAVGNNYFAVLLPDEIFLGKSVVLKQLIRIAQQYQAHVIAVCQVPKEHISRYASISIRKTLEPHIYEIDNIIEKPSRDQVSSLLAPRGRYVFSPVIFDSLKSIPPGYNGEYQLTDAIADMIKKGERVIAFETDEIPYDTGNPQGFTEAILMYALQDPVYADIIKKIVAQIANDQ